MLPPHCHGNPCNLQREELCPEASSGVFKATVLVSEQTVTRVEVFAPALCSFSYTPMQIFLRHFLHSQ